MNVCDQCHKGGIDRRPHGVRRRQWSRMTGISDLNNWGMPLTENARGGSGGGQYPIMFGLQPLNLMF